MHLRGYMNSPTEPEFTALVHGMEYLTYHPHETTMYSRKNIFKLNEIPHQYLFKSSSAYIKKTQE